MSIVADMTRSRKIRPEPFLAVQAEGQSCIGVNAALMKFVENDKTDAGECGIILDQAGQNAFCDHLDPCGSH